MSSSAARSRACKECKQLKVRCHPSQADPNICDRCLHANKECRSAGKRRRPRDRIAELESQVARLTLELQQHQKSNPLDDGGSNGGKLVTTRLDIAHSESKVVAFLDARISIATQQQLLDGYVQQCFPIFPLFPLIDSDVTRLRRDAPILLFTIFAFAVPSLLPTPTRNDLIREAMRMYAVELVIRPRRRLEAVWSLLITGFWFRACHGEPHITVYDLVQLATGMAIDIGLGGTQISITPGGGHGQIFNPGSLNAQRTWLACFVGSSSLSIGIRRPNSNARWTSRHDDCLNTLSQAPFQSRNDRLFLHIVRGERLCSQIATTLGLCDPTDHHELATTASIEKRLLLQRSIDDWTEEFSSQTDLDELLLYRYSAMIYLNEPVLYTHTNKLTFASPPHAEKLTELDFASPPITGTHVSALYSLRDACHALLDWALNPARADFMAACPLPYAGSVSHALFVLAKLYISVTAKGNTYGAVLRPAELRFDQYLERMAILTASVEQLNPGSYNGPIFACHHALRDWLKAYAPETNFQEVGGSVLPSDDHSHDSALPSAGENLGTLGNIEEEEWLMLGSHYTWMNDLIPEDFTM